MEEDPEGQNQEMRTAGEDTTPVSTGLLVNCLPPEWIVFCKAIHISSILYQAIAAPLEFGLQKQIPYERKIHRWIGSVVGGVQLICGVAQFIHKKPATSYKCMGMMILLLVLDSVVILLPWGYGYFAEFKDSEYTWIYSFQLLRLFSIRFAFDYHKSLSSWTETFDSRSVRAIYRMIAVTFLRMWWVHVAACGLFYTSTILGDSQGGWVAKSFEGKENVIFVEYYVTSLYFGVVSGSTVGYGDISPLLLNERLVFIAIFVFSVGMTSILESRRSARREREAAESARRDRRAILDVLETHGTWITQQFEDTIALQTRIDIAVQGIQTLVHVAQAAHDAARVAAEVTAEVAVELAALDAAQAMQRAAIALVVLPPLPLEDDDLM